MTREPGRFGALLKRHRAAAGLTREELADRSGVSVRGIAALEGGERLAPRRDTIALLGEALSLTSAQTQELTAAGRGDLVTGTAQGSQERAVQRPRSGGGLPLQVTSFLGRQDEVTEIAKLTHQPQVRLVTLTGPGGTGKTRLGLRVAEEVGAYFPDGARFVDLAPLADPGLVVAAVADALGVVETGSRRLDRSVEDFLGDRRMLLLLDNFEQVLPAAGWVGHLLEVSPSTTVLVTSRTPLRLRAEHEWPVTPLPLPAGRGELSPEALAGFDAVRLFIERARAVSPAFLMDAGNAEAVAEICRRLDGLPLAIELAAARTRLMSPPALVRRLHDRLSVLVEGPRDAPDRQRTLRAAISWSYDLLDDAPRRVFEELAVFAGGRSLDAVEAVCTAEGLDDPLEAVNSLVDSSLLRSVPGTDGEPRLSMLETVQQYALERLELRSDAGAVRRRHAEHFAALATRARHEIVGADQVRWLNQLEQEMGNFRTALDWAMSHQEHGTALTLVTALARFWERRNHFSEGRRWLQQVLSMPCPDGPERASALLAAAILAWRENDLTEAHAAAQGALESYERHHDDGGIGCALIQLGLIAEDGALEQAGPLLEQGFASLQRAGAGWEYEKVLATLSSSLDLVFNEAFDEGIPQLERAARELEQLGDTWGLMMALGNLAEVRAAHGAHDTALRLATRAALLADEVGDRLALAWMVSGIAALASVSGSLHDAVMLWGGEERLRADVGAGHVVDGRWDNVDENKASVREQLGTPAWEAALEAGRALPHEALIDMLSGSVVEA